MRALYGTTVTAAFWRRRVMRGNLIRAAPLRDAPASVGLSARNAPRRHGVRRMLTPPASIRHAERWILGFIPIRSMERRIPARYSARRGQEDASSMALTKCASCGTPFAPRPQSPQQLFCSKPDCQRERRRRWQLAKRRADPDYRLNDLAAAAAWRLKHPNYWRTYERQRPARGIFDGLYRMQIIAVSDSNEDVWIVRLVRSGRRHTSSRSTK